MVGATAVLLLLVGAAVLAPLSSAAAAASSLRGHLVLPAMPPTSGPRPNPYPGSTRALPHAVHATAGAVTDAVVYVPSIPPSLTTPSPVATRPQLEQPEQAFVPRVIAVQVGATVEFPNRDPIYHNVFSVSPAKRFDLGKYPKGQSRRVRFDKTGLVQVFCDIHSDMAAFILVLPHHVFARPDGDGAFALPALPEGTYQVRVWHPDFGEMTREVTLTDGGGPVELRY